MSDVKGPLPCERTIDQKFALGDLQGSLRCLAAEIMRISAGGGDCIKLSSVIAETTGAYFKYKDAFGFWPTRDTIASVLDPKFAMENDRPWTSGIEYDPRIQGREDAKDKIRKGALRDIAGMYANQPTQQRKGEILMIQGVRDWHAA